jgi:hypothetical protein
MCNQIDMLKLVRNWRQRPLDEQAITLNSLNLIQISHGLPRDIAAVRNEIVAHLQEIRQLEGRGR